MFSIANLRWLNKELVYLNIVQYKLSNIKGEKGLKEMKTASELYRTVSSMLTYMKRVIEKEVKE